MKTTTICPTRYATYRRNTYTPYPGASTRHFLSQLLNIALAAAFTMAVIVILLFLMVL